MKSILGGLMVVTTLMMFSQNNVISQTIERSDVPVEHTWKLSDLYSTDEAWQQAKKDLASKMENITLYKGKLSSSSAQLLECLDLDSDISKEYRRLYSYASMNSDQDTRESTYQAMKQQISQLGTDYGSKASFIEPEIVKMDNQKINSFLQEEPGLKVYKMYLGDIERRKAHKLSEKKKK